MYTTNNKKKVENFPLLTKKEGSLFSCLLLPSLIICRTHKPGKGASRNPFRTTKGAFSKMVLCVLALMYVRAIFIAFYSPKMYAFLLHMKSVTFSRCFIEMQCGELFTSFSQPRIALEFLATSNESMPLSNARVLHTHFLI